MIICTYRREDLLDSTLKTLLVDPPDRTEFSLLVVDNAGSPEAEAVARKYAAHYLYEPKLGLSHARNRGAAAANTPWLVYFDDDIRAPAGLLRRFARRLHGTDYAAVGGQYTHWFATPPPSWMMKYYASPRQPSSATEFSPLPAGQYLSGGVLAVRRSALLEVGGFDAALGMTGDQIGMGEESFMQDELRRLGYRIFYDPDLVINHLVQPYKYALQKQLGLSYAHGRAIARIEPIPAGARWSFLIMEFLRVTFVSLPFNLARLLLKPGYVWQHAYLDTAKKYVYAVGRFRASR